MTLNREFMLERSRSRDAAFDGRFLTGVLTTGIYCLPSCPARKPKPENVRFFTSEESARAAGLRPCLRCRPDRFFADCDPEVELAESLAREIRDAPGTVRDARALARRAKIGSTRLARLFRRHFHQGPAEFLQSARVESVCRELLAGRGRVLDIALEAGFESSSAFHEAFRRRTRMTPQSYRGLASSNEFELSLPTDFRATETLDSIARDPESRCEQRAGSSCGLAVRIGARVARLEIELARTRARIRVKAKRTLAPRDRARAHRMALRVLGLHGDPAPFERRESRASVLAPLIERRPGLRTLPFADTWEATLFAMVGQRVHLRVACSRRRALTERAGEDVGGGLRTSPSVKRTAEIGAAGLADLGLSRAQAEALDGLAQSLAAGSCDLGQLSRGSAVRAERQLLAQRGIGPWTAQYVMMRGFGLADCAPAGDSALATALQARHHLDERPGPDAVRALMERHAPDRSLATWHLWKSLGDDA